MIFRRVDFVSGLIVVVALLWLPQPAAAIAIRGTVAPVNTSGQYMSLTMTITDTTTTFEMTGPDYSWFAFGFDTTTMLGYSLIIEGTNDSRSGVEQNLLGVGNPGSPQLQQNINFVDVTHDVDNALTTVIIERPNNTGDPNDPVFSTGMTSLNVIAAFDSFASPDEPNPTLSYHGRGGRGEATVFFAPVPEPASLALAAILVAAVALGERPRRATGLRRSLHDANSLATRN
jgi:hypothetical protein